MKWGFIQVFMLIGSVLLLGGSGGMPPRKILKIALLRLNLEVILTENYKCKFCAGHLY